MIVRSRDWWSIRRLDDRPEVRRGGGPLVHALLERDGRPVGYALYRLVQEGSTPETWTKTIRVVEAFGVDDAATRDVWRFLLADRLDRPRRGIPPACRPPAPAARRSRQQAAPLGVGRALAAGRRRAGRACRAVRTDPAPPSRSRSSSDPHFPENVGSWTIAGRRGAPRAAARRRPGWPSTRSARRSSEGSPSRSSPGRVGPRRALAAGIVRADAAFRASAAPWTAEIF